METAEARVDSIQNGEVSLLVCYGEHSEGYADVPLTWFPESQRTKLKPGTIVLCEVDETLLLSSPRMLIETD